MSRISWPVIDQILPWSRYSTFKNVEDIQTYSQSTMHPWTSRIIFYLPLDFAKKLLCFSRSFQAVLFRCNAIILTLHNSFQHTVQFTAVLKKWIQTVGPAASYGCLAKALQHPIVRRSELATKYCHSFRETGESKFCLTQFTDYPSVKRSLSEPHR